MTSNRASKICFQILVLIVILCSDLGAQDVTIYNATVKTVEISTEEISGTNFDASTKTIHVRYFEITEKIHTFKMDSNNSFYKSLEKIENNQNNPFALDETIYICYDITNKEWTLISIEKLKPVRIRYAKLNELKKNQLFATEWRKTSTNASMVALFSSLKK